MTLHAASVQSKVSTILLMVVPYLRFVNFLAANFNKNFDLQDYNEKKLDITFELPYPTPTLQEGSFYLYYFFITLHIAICAVEVFNCSSVLRGEDNRDILAQSAQILSKS